MAEQPIELEDLIQPLREEIVESQKARIDLLKYKLLVIGGIGTIGLGISKEFEKIPVILALIPICCLYIDILCHHNTMRILVIGQFFNKNRCLYEGFMGDLGDILGQVGKLINDKKYRNASGYFFELEDFALYWSTIFISIVLAIYSLRNPVKYILDHAIPMTISLKDFREQFFVANTHFSAYTVLITSLLIIFLSDVIRRLYNERKKTLFATVEGFKYDPENEPDDNE